MYELLSSTLSVTSETPPVECPRCGITTIATPIDKPAVARPLLLAVDDEPQVVERLAANAGFEVVRGAVARLAAPPILS